MESLEVVDVFCTASECATTFTSNFSTISIFIIFIFLILDFLILTCEMLARSSSGWVLDYFLDRTWSYLFQKQDVYSNSHYFVPYFSFCDSCPNLKILCMGQMWRGVITMSSYEPKSSSIKKYEVSAFKRTVERPSSHPRSKVILFWSSKLGVLFSFPQIHHLCLHAYFT